MFPLAMSTEPNSNGSPHNVKTKEMANSASPPTERRSNTTPVTPQMMLLRLQVSLHVLLLSCGSFQHRAAVAFKSTQVGILQDFKMSVVDGKLWLLPDWNATDDSPCGWTGVSCQNGVNVSHLDLHNQSLEGTLPGTLGSLESLESLDISNNRLRGTIPDLGGLRKLKVLNLELNSLSGTLPAVLGSLESLESLDISDNQLRGTLPASLGSLAKLESLDFSYNELRGTIPDLGGLHKLTALFLQGNSLSGTLSAALGSLNLQSLEDLNLAGNMFSGPIPEDISKAQNLKVLQLYENRVTGRIPGSFSQLRSLEELYLMSNSLSGTISVVTGLQNLTHLDLRSNRFSGGISDVENLTGLVYLYLGDNQFSGRVPSFNRSKNLKWVGLSGNRLAGRIPYFGKLRNLLLLDLSRNLLQGEIPSTIATVMAGLLTLNLSGNALQGEISPAIARMSELEDLDLSLNSLSGRIPEELGGLSNLNTLNLSFNHLTGTIPAEIGFISGLESLVLASNDLRGNIPNEIRRMPNLKELNLAFNRLAGARILSDGWPAAMERLDLSGNGLSTWFPSRLLQDTMTYLNLSHNSINGSIDFWGWPGQELENRRLETLDLSNNLLEGDIAETALQTLPKLKELRLRNNSFRGDIPVEHRMWRSLEVLDVSQNALNLSTRSGRRTLQIIFDALTDLVELRVSNNNAAGSLPTSASNLAQLRVLDLSNSNLTGNFTDTFHVFTQAYLPALTFVNLSNNGLRGEIPPGLAELRNLTFLDLSNNDLSGPIPDLPWLLPNATFLFSGNDALCGALVGTECPRPGHGLQVKLWQLLVVVGASVVTLMGSFLLLAWRWRLYSKRHQQDEDLIAQLLDRDTATVLMSLQDLRRATNNFSSSCQIGEGGFGLVYKGILDDGTTVAIKRSKLETTTAENKLTFLNEVKILSQVHHRNLVKLLGCCLEQRIALLVFEYVPNGNLEQHLLCTTGAPPLKGRLHSTGPQELEVRLSWRQRLKIAVQTADALAYLHSSASPPIFHLDVKSANVLLDENLNAKVGDFGVSRLAPAPNGTHITAHKMQGTVGYMDPDYFSTFKLTGKSDVYAFGVVLLELISDQAAVDPSRADKEDAALSSLAARLLGSGDFHKLVAPALSHTFQSQIGCDSIWDVGRLAVRCLQRDPRDRPYMSEVLSELQSLWLQFGSSFDSQSHSGGSPVFTPHLPCRPFSSQSDGDVDQQRDAVPSRDVFTT